MVPAFFGTSDRPLYGVYHPSAGTRTPVTGIVLCPPIGLEYTRTHWLLRRLADQLAKSGMPSFRFDYSGTGDSWGGLEDVTLTQWMNDVRTAAQELKDNSGVRKVSLLGVRLGAAIAWLTALDGLPIHNLVLWDPVTSGRQYLHDLETLHREKLGRWKFRREADNSGTVELLGFCYPTRLLDEIKQVHLGTAIPKVSGETTLLASLESTATKDLGTHCHRYQSIEDAGDWDRVEEAERALLATKIPQAAFQAMAGGKP